jgi:hypothetical protein
MTSGIAARAIRRAADARPRANANVFGGSELVGLFLILTHVHSTPRR